MSGVAVHAEVPEPAHRWASNWGQRDVCHSARWSEKKRELARYRKGR